MKPTLLLVFLLTAAVLGVSSCAFQAPPHPDWQARLTRVRAKRDLSILFIGNSYTFDVPRELAKITTRNGLHWHIEKVAHNGWSLSRHAENPETLAAIDSHPWDVIVLQEQSLLPASAITRRLHTLPAARKLVARCQAVGALPVIYQTWGRKSIFAAQNPRIRFGIRQTAARLGNTPVVPVSDAWAREISAGHADELYQPDGSHPTKAGNHLTATEFYRFLTSAGAH